MEEQENMDSLEPGSSSLSDLIKEEILGGEDSTELPSLETTAVPEIVPSPIVEMSDCIKETGIEVQYIPYIGYLISCWGFRGLERTCVVTDVIGLGM